MQNRREQPSGKIPPTATINRNAPNTISRPISSFHEPVHAVARQFPTRLGQDPQPLQPFPTQTDVAKQHGRVVGNQGEGDGRGKWQRRCYEPSRRCCHGEKGAGCWG